MSLFVPTYDGFPIFGLSVKMQMLPNATQHQIDAFFGVGGTVSLFGGSRGRVFLIGGVLFANEEFDDASTIATINSLEGIIHSYADGVARILTDTRGNAWPFVVFRDEFQPDPMGCRPAGDQGWCLPYKCIFHGLI
jgi:hypothetical protein